MKRSHLAVCFLFACVAILALSGPSYAKSDKPNVVLIFCDDLGYGDIGPFGCTHHRTPNLDRMAAEGRKFTSFYSTSGVCTPSRSSLMTGCYPKRVGMHENETGSWVLFPGNKRGLNPDEITVAEILKGQGYATAMVGKWHLGDQPVFLPTRQGFDQYFGIPFSNDMGRYQKRGDLPLMRDEEVIEGEPDQALLTKRYTEEALRFIREHKDGPFFLYLPHTMPHNPVHASEAFKDKSANGVYGDAVEEIDWSTGRILDTIRELGIAEDTLVIFTSDNGAANRWGGCNTPLRGFKGSTWEGGMREPCIMWRPGTIPAGTTCDELTSTIDILPTLARMAGSQAPTDRKIDGADISPLILGEEDATSPHDVYFYYFRRDLQAVRGPRYKLILARGEGKKAVPEQLYDLKNDIGESTNLLGGEPTEEALQAKARLKQAAAACRLDLGDGPIEGLNCRAPGHVEDAEPLTKP